MGVLPNSAMKVHRILCDNHWVTKERGGGMRERAEKKNVSLSGSEKNGLIRERFEAALPLPSWETWVILSTSLNYFPF